MADWRALLNDPGFFRTAGAGAIGRRVAAALRARAENWQGRDAAALRRVLADTGAVAREIKPTLATVAHAVAATLAEADRLLARGADAGELQSGVMNFLDCYITASENATEQIAGHGAALIPDGAAVLVHSFSEAVRAVLARARGDGRRLRVVATASLPLGEGRQMAAALAAGGIPVTLIPDPAAAAYLPGVGLVLVGADAVLPDGAVVNKTGTHLLALAARTCGTPLYVAAETMKVWPEGDLQMEESPPGEVWENPPAGVTVRNPLFEVTPAALINEIITEQGVFRPEQLAERLHRRTGVTP